jgi:hypothetical protein
MRSLLLAALAAAALATAGAGGAQAEPAQAVQAAAVAAGVALPVVQPGEPTPFQIVCLIAVVGGLFALIALMPDFDGWESGDGGEIGRDE